MNNEKREQDLNIALANANETIDSLELKKSTLESQLSDSEHKLSISTNNQADAYSVIAEHTQLIAHLESEITWLHSSIADLGQKFGLACASISDLLKSNATLTEQVQGLVEQKAQLIKQSTMAISSAQQLIDKLQRTQPQTTSSNTSFVTQENKPPRISEVSEKENKADIKNDTAPKP